MEDGSYFRIKNLTVGYDFPKKFYDEDVVAKLISEIKLSDSEEESSDIELKSEVYSN